MQTTIIYKNDKQLEKGLRQMGKAGWAVVSITPQAQGYGCLKTGCLGLLFLPLALLGKKQSKTIVVYRKGNKT